MISRQLKRTNIRYLFVVTLQVALNLVFDRSCKQTAKQQLKEHPKAQFQCPLKRKQQFLWTF